MEQVGVGFLSMETTACNDTVARAETGQAAATRVHGAVIVGDPADPVIATVQILPMHAEKAALTMCCAMHSPILELLPAEDQDRCQPWWTSCGWQCRTKEKAR